ncbi:DNA-binding NarL/FixJ family response regulator [Alteromonas sp. 76-1]|jgi:DNA-binding NarL/FixJ family response regulator|uniref:response regulator n=1 Tax=Alteromonas sp. 76-1 TaxID=2358187 RepID=UPI000FD16E24|nr:response regulator transcription factor [Alteromonas sp. 76-1]VEL98550.1 DNA-binding NarL/FixJ family response regulator [Alteromonas sp. 76-1]
MTIRVVLADDHVLMRQGVSQMLNATANISVIGECDDGVELVSAVVKLSPDVILMDISMPRMSGLVAIDKILSQRSDAKVLVLSMHNEVEYVEAMRDAGAKGYVLKESSGDVLVEAIKKVAAGQTVFPDSVSDGEDEQTQRYISPLSVLTRREREVFFLVAAGNTSKKIGELLNMSLKTAENHRSNIYKKLNLSSSAELIRMAGKAGLLE